MIVTPGHLTQRAEFYRQLAQLTAAGLGVIRALEQISQHPPGRSFRKPLRHSLEELAKGKTFTDSLRHADWLPEFDLSLIEAGERSGRIDSCFRVLADYYDNRAALAKQMISQLIYPAFLIHFAALIFIVVLPYAFSEFSKSLTVLVCEAVLALAPVYLITAFIIYANQARHGEKWRAALEKSLNWVPLLGTARRSLALSRLAMALEALVSAGVGVVEAWDFAAVASNSPALRQAVAAWKPQFDAGRTPAELVHSSRIFPETFTNLYHSGEISGKLDETLRRLHVYYQEEGTHKFQLLAQWVPRAIYILVALLIAYEIVQAWNHLYGPNSELGHLVNGQF
ncbi:MAG TPA: type II secretion system F family protein [Verrucomicrobiae bacterium]|nr:type II secretion system F family protein [Verrucomicrobiae bacterium]